MAETNELLYSLRSGNNYYRVDGQQAEIFGVPRVKATNAQTHESCYLVPVDADLQNTIILMYGRRLVPFPPERCTRNAYWRQRGRLSDAEPFSEEWLRDHCFDYLIERPLDTSLFMWPIDIVRSQDALNLVFPLRDTTQYESLHGLLGNLFTKNRRRFAEEAVSHNPVARNVAMGLLTVFDNLERTRCVYGGFDIAHMYFDKGDSSHVLCDFNESAAIDTRASDGAIVSLDLSRRMTGEYVLPFYWLKMKHGDISVTLFNRYAQRFAFAAMLFRLLVGRLPYDGRSIEPAWADNIDEEAHELWLRQYQAERPVFIFDPNDLSNAVGGPDAPEIDRHFVANWQKLPEAVRREFEAVFDTANVLFEGEKRHFPTARRWRELLLPLLTAK